MSLCFRIHSKIFRITAYHFRSEVYVYAFFVWVIRSINVFSYTFSVSLVSMIRRSIPFMYLFGVASLDRNVPFSLSLILIGTYLFRNIFFIEKYLFVSFLWVMTVVVLMSIFFSYPLFPVLLFVRVSSHLLSPLRSTGSNTPQQR